jgi:hypothetical protein
MPPKADPLRRLELRKELKQLPLSNQDIPALFKSDEFVGFITEMWKLILHSLAFEECCLYLNDKVLGDILSTN